MSTSIAADHLRTGNFAKCVAVCDEALALSPPTAEAVGLVQLKMNALVALGRFREALDAIRRGSSAFSDSERRALAPVHAYCLYKLNRFGEAADVVRSGRSASAESANGVDLKLMYLEAQIV